MPKSTTRNYRRRRTTKVNFARRFTLAGLFALVLAAIPFINLNAASLSSASMSLSDPRPNFNSNYTFQGSGVSLSTIRCIKMVFADTATGSTIPNGMSTSGGGVTFDTTNSNYMPTPASWTFTKTLNGTFTWTNAGGETPASASARKLIVNGITNSSSADTRFWVRVNTYSNVDCATGAVDNSTVQYILTNGSTLTLTVDSSLSFTVNSVGTGQACNGASSTQASTATTIPFGTVTTAANSIVCQDLQAATNSTNGYTIFARYTGQPANALNQTIADHAGTNATPTSFTAAGTEGYGYTTNDFTLGTGTAARFNANLWAAMTTTNTEVAYESTGVNSATYRVGHQVGISSTTRPGTYSTTIIYTCTPVY